MNAELHKNSLQKNTRGSTLAMAIVFLGIFLVLTTAVLSYVQLEITVATRSVAGGQAFAAAEAGIEYARWRLAHAPDDFTSSTHDYRDPQGNVTGKFALTVTPRNTCSGNVTILSRGESIINPRQKRTAKITYGTPALTQYSFLTNANIWFGGSDELKGPVHANGGIRMDAKNKSRMTSAKATYICGREHGCPSPTTKPGIWGSGDGGEKGLWDFPKSEINFATIALDLRAFQKQATGSGTAFGPSGAFGYHAKLLENGTVTIARVTEIKPKVWGYDGRVGWVETAEGIKTEVALKTVTLPEASACGVENLLFFEDTLWVDGATKRPVTLIAARFSTSNGASILINGNLETPASGSAGKLGSIGLIAEKDVLIPLESPSTLEVHAALVAQNGHVFRNYYCSDERLNKYGYKCKASYASYVLRDTMNVKGTTVSNQIIAWTWVDESGRVISGYRGGETTYETRLIYTPPPFFPRYGENRILNWEEVNE